MRKGLSLSSSSLSAPSLMSSSSGEVKESKNVLRLTIVKKIVQFWFFLVSFVFVCATDLLMTKIILLPSRRSCHYRNLISHSKPNSKFKNWLKVNLFFVWLCCCWIGSGGVWGSKLSFSEQSSKYFCEIDLKRENFVLFYLFLSFVHA